MRSDSDIGGKILAFIVTSPIVVGVAALFCGYQVFAEGYVASVLWRWFAVPQGLRSLPWETFAGAACLLSLAGLKVSSATSDDTRSGREKFAAWFGYMVAPWLILAAGWLVK